MRPRTARAARPARSLECSRDILRIEIDRPFGKIVGDNGIWPETDLVDEAMIDARQPDRAEGRLRRHKTPGLVEQASFPQQRIHLRKPLPGPQKDSCSW